MRGTAEYWVGGGCRYWRYYGGIEDTEEYWCGVLRGTVGYCWVLLGEFRKNMWFKKVLYKYMQITKNKMFYQKLKFIRFS